MLIIILRVSPESKIPVNENSLADIVNFELFLVAEPGPTGGMYKCEKVPIFFSESTFFSGMKVSFFLDMLNYDWILRRNQWELLTVMFTIT